MQYSLLRYKCSCLPTKRAHSWQREDKEARIVSSIAPITFSFLSKRIEIILLLIGEPQCQLAHVRDYLLQVLQIIGILDWTFEDFSLHYAYTGKRDKLERTGTKESLWGMRKITVSLQIWKREVFLTAWTASWRPAIFTWELLTIMQSSFKKYHVPWNAWDTRRFSRSLSFAPPLMTYAWRCVGLQTSDQFYHRLIYPFVI